nr:putative glycolipid-binding domain-containing protein [uncultured Actinoplanes sp.]
MSLETTTSQATGVRPGVARPGTSPLVWQRTDTIGTELVFPDGPRAMSGTAVVGGPKPYTTRWHAALGTDDAVRKLAVVCEGHGWRRELELTRGDDGWECRTESAGELDGPEPGIADPGGLPDVVRLPSSPVFLTWAMRALGVTAGGEAVTAPTARVLTPSLAVVVGESRYQRLGDHRLRVSGDEPAASYDLDAAGVVTYQPGRLRIVR